MIVEMRTYTLSIGATGRYFKAYGEKGLAVQKRILGHLVGYYSVEVGGLNKVIQLWAYESLDDVKEVGGLVQHQENQILSPAPFFQVPPAV
jgi:hypothetical protein